MVEGNIIKRGLAFDFGISLLFCGLTVGASEKPDPRVDGKLPSECGHHSVCTGCGTSEGPHAMALEVWHEKCW